ncbi:hypothetical protein C8T65DRAFT_64888 [Cerioporus squamosus]|nr:hypothetical protein C8T65DRAFT_64888 [Cerioporus squamosus]
MMYDDNDPNQLARVLCGLSEIEDRQKPLPVLKEPRPKDKQTAQAFRPCLGQHRPPPDPRRKGAGHCRRVPACSATHPPGFVLAQNTGIADHVVHHLVHLVEHLRRVRELLLQEGLNDKTQSASAPDTGGEGPVFEFTAVQNTPLQREIQEGEIAGHAAYHCWEKSSKAAVRERGPAPARTVCETRRWRPRWGPRGSARWASARRTRRRSGR